ncbi:MAG: GspE/PulE family protein [bacterium]
MAKEDTTTKSSMGGTVRVAAPAARAESAAPEKRKKIGEILVDAGVMTPAQLELALREQRRTSDLLGRVFKRLGFATEQDISRALAGQAGIGHTELKNTLVDPAAIRLVPLDVAKKYRVLPLGLNDGVLTVAVCDPHDVMAMDQLKKLTGIQKIVRLAAEEDSIAKAVETYYDLGAMTTENIIEGAIQSALQSERSRTVEADPPTVRLVNHVVIEAIKKRATDIHIEPDERITRVRYRIDGVLHPGPILPKSIHPGVVARIKIISRLDISETRLPQDGGAQFSYLNRELDLRISTLPTHQGEKVVIRLLDKEGIKLGLDNLGFSQENLKTYRALFEKPHGIILISGPTGSGKTTTLYSSLLELNSLELNISTVEDPVEYKLSLINQCQVNEKAGLTFATALRAFLRQDPDVILIGEIRDRETADMAFRAAMTGHLVFSTIHTNDASSAFPRLLDIGVPPYLISSSLLGVVAQRLVRKICSDCKQKYQAPSEELAFFGMSQGQKLTLYKGKGCEKCSNTGFRGRVCVTEVLIVTPEVRKLIKEGVNSDTVLKQAVQHGMKVMLQDGMAKILEGVTTLQEVSRVIMVEQTLGVVAGLQEAEMSLPFAPGGVVAASPPDLQAGRFEPLPRFQQDFTEFFASIAGEIAGFIAGVVFDSRGEVLAFSSFLSSLPLEDTTLLQLFLDAADELREASEILLTTPRYFLYYQGVPDRDLHILVACDRHTSNLSSIRAEVERAYRFFPADLLAE